MLTIILPLSNYGKVQLRLPFCPVNRSQQIPQNAKNCIT
jgi:hypothetical protein